MFSDTRAPGEHRGYQHSNPHLNLWLHNRFRAHHSDMGLNGQRRRTDANLTYPNRAKEVGFKSQEVINTIHGKERMGPHLNGLGLEEPDLSSQEGSPSRWSQGQSPEPGLRHSASVRNHYTEHSFVWNHRQTLPHPSVKNYVMAPAPAPPKQFKEVPQRNMGGPTLRSQQSPSKHCPTPEDVQTRPPSGHQGSRRGPGLTGSKRSHRKVVRDQIRRVVENLEEVLGGLKDIHQEMKEVVQQIELLTSSIDLSEGDASPSLPSDSSSTSSGVAMGSSHQRPRGEEARQGDAALSSLTRTNSPQRHNPASSPVRLPHQLAPNPHRSSPVRPPTPGLSPLSTNPPHPNTHDPSVKSKSLYYPLNPASNSTLFHTLGLSPHKKSPPPHPSALGPSVTVETQTGPPMRAPRPVSPPRGLKTQTRVEGVRTTSAKSLGLTQGQTVPHGPGRVPGPKGRKPPPYPHNGHFDRGASKGKDPRKAPPYPVKRRLLSTTV
ncbi:hypothetical protein J4Q44_G00095610 [Coregonus suidteri]|uniref:Uncharacterized protein n=1 Tax=Coregonus suidteri TaxID=861788 RepID=A0AAN8M2D7_9TELE